MLKIQEIREIIKLIDQSSIQRFTYEVEGGKIKLEKNNGGHVVATPAIVEAPAVAVQPVAAPVAEVPVKEESASVQVQEQSKVEATPAVADDASLHKITSPMVGTFYAASSPEAEAYVQKGDKVTTESIVCIVEAMKLFNEIEAEVDGEIVEILVKDGELVEYGQPLFLVKVD